MDKVDLSFTTISSRIREIKFPDIDLVVGIATGGVVPASLVAFYLQCPLEIIQINYRDEENSPRYEFPKILQDFDRLISSKRILLVDDVSVSGKTLEVAKAYLADSTVFTFVLKGQADYTAFPEISKCVNWPWKVAASGSYISIFQSENS